MSLNTEKQDHRRNWNDCSTQLQPPFVSETSLATSETSTFRVHSAPRLRKTHLCAAPRCAAGDKPTQVQRVGTPRLELEGIPNISH